MFFFVGYSSILHFSPTRPHWAELVIESPCPSVCVCVCLSAPSGAVFFEASHWPSDQMTRSRPLIGPPSLPPLKTWKLGNSETWRLGNSETKKLGNSQSRKLGNSETWKLGNLETWKLRNRAVFNRFQPFSVVINRFQQFSTIFSRFQPFSAILN